MSPSPCCLKLLSPSTRYNSPRKNKILPVNSTQLTCNKQVEVDFRVTGDAICNQTISTKLPVNSSKLACNKQVEVDFRVTGDAICNQTISTKLPVNSSKLACNKQVEGDFRGTGTAICNETTNITRSAGYVRARSSSEVPAPLSPTQTVSLVGTRLDTFNDFHVLSYNVQCLHYGKWFYEGISNADAKSLLQNSKHGTFLIRFSSSSKYLYTLSISSLQGVTSVRIAYNNGSFHLDCDKRLEKQMPHFKSIIDLVQFYSDRRNPSLLNNGHRCIWVDCNNKRYNSSELTAPKLHSVPSLAHLCRLSVNNSSMEQNRTLEVSLKDDWRDSLGLPKFLVDFLKNYPFVM